MNNHRKYTVVCPYRFIAINIDFALEAYDGGGLQAMGYGRDAVCVCKGDDGYCCAYRTEAVWGSPATRCACMGCRLPQKVAIESVLLAQSLRGHKANLFHASVAASKGVQGLDKFSPNGVKTSSDRINKLHQ